MTGTTAGWRAELDRRERRRRRGRRLRPLLRRWVGPTEVSCELFTGQRLRVVLPEIVGSALYRHGYIEAPVSGLLLERLRPGMVFIDVGAHYGYFSLLASRLVEPGGTVVAFEPGRHTLGLLQRNVGSAPNVRIEPVALADRAGSALLRDFGPRHSALNTVLPGARVPPAERRRLRPELYEVPAVTLDAYVAATGLVPDVVKIDAEGAEPAILRGMRGLLRDAAPVVVLETGDYEGMAAPPTRASIEELEGAGYRGFEYRDGLRPSGRRSHYGYGNLVFLAGVTPSG